MLSHEVRRRFLVREAVVLHVIPRQTLHALHCVSTVVQKVDSSIDRINVYPGDNLTGFPNTYLLDSGLSGVQRHLSFEQPRPELDSAQCCSSTVSVLQYFCGIAHNKFYHVSTACNG